MPYLLKTWSSPLLRRSEMEFFGLICMSRAHHAPPHSHINRTVLLSTRHKSSGKMSTSPMSSYCVLPLLLRRSEIEMSRLICLSCANFGALHIHIQRAAVKPGLARPVFSAVFLDPIESSLQKQGCRSTFVCQRYTSKAGGLSHHFTISVSGAHLACLRTECFLAKL